MEFNKPENVNDLMGKGYDDWTDEVFTHKVYLRLVAQTKKGVNTYRMLLESCISSFEQKIRELREVAERLERVHWGTTVGSLTGGVVGAAGGIASLVGIALAPFTMGASLVVTGVGISTAVAGGLTSGISNITNMVNQSVDRNSIEQILKDYAEMMKPISTCLLDLSKNFEALDKLSALRQNNHEECHTKPEDVIKAVTGMGRGLAEAPKILRFAQVANLGKIGELAARGTRVAKAFNGVLSAFFIGVDIYFITTDSKEIHNMRNPPADPSKSQSATVKFIGEVRKTASELEGGLQELREVMEAFDKINCCDDDHDSSCVDCEVNEDREQEPAL